MSADVINIAVSTSSVQKGESLLDTARTIQAMGADIVVIRHGASGAPALLAREVQAGVINAGDGAHEHPTQGLLDLFTLRERVGRIAGLKVAIIGDILHSRVARSNIYGLRKLGAEVAVVGPRTLMPAEVERFGVSRHHGLSEVLPWADVLMVLRLQRERHSRGYLGSPGEYAREYGLTVERLREAKQDVIVMHPGPANLGVEISDEVSRDPRSVITTQVTNGVAIRMALLYLLSGGDADGVAD